MDGALRAIAVGRRRRILALIWHHEMCAGDIAAHFSVSRPAVSQHLRCLRESGLIEERRDGTRRYYRVNQGAVAKLRRFLDAFLADDGLAGRAGLGRWVA
jgi:DNA-binding transcriptional ArsR family regulator